MLTSAATLALLGVSLPMSLANPVPDPFPQSGAAGILPNCNDDTVVHSTNTVPGPPQTGSQSCTGTGSCYLDESSSYSVDVTVTLGAELNLDFAKIAGDAKISASVSTTKSSGAAQGTQKQCPSGPWTCALIITPAMVEVKGTRFKQDPSTGGCQHDGKGKDFTIQYPKKAGDNTAMMHVDVCGCRNLPHWADPGAPTIPCPQDCAPY